MTNDGRQDRQRPPNFTATHTCHTGADPARSAAMQYLLLIHVDEALVAALPEGRFDTMMRGCFGHADELRAAGILLESQQLQPPATGRSIRVRNGQRSIVDGPFT